MIDNVVDISVIKESLCGYRPMSKTVPFKGIVVGKLTSKQMDNIPIGEFVVRESGKPLDRSIRFNYFIDSDGNKFKCLPDNVAGNVCKFDVYSRKASQIFPTLCPPTDARYSPRDYSPDEAVISIMVKVDGKTMTLTQEASLRELVRDLFPFDSNRNPIDNIYSRDSFPQDHQTKENVGSLFPSLIQFMIFKKSVMK